MIWCIFKKWTYLYICHPNLFISLCLCIWYMYIIPSWMFVIFKFFILLFFSVWLCCFLRQIFSLPNSSLLSFFVFFESISFLYFHAMLFSPWVFLPFECRCLCQHKACAFITLSVWVLYSVLSKYISLSHFSCF